MILLNQENNDFSGYQNEEVRTEVGNIIASLTKNQKKSKAKK